MRRVPEIKLIRTDTTLDLSQKAEKVCLNIVGTALLYGGQLGLLSRVNHWCACRRRAAGMECAWHGRNLVCTGDSIHVLLCFFLVSESVRDTRSAWRYCKTRATLGRGVAQALQNPNHGLNNSLKLM